MDETKTFLAVTDTANQQNVGLVIIAVGIGIGFAAPPWAIGAIAAALGVLQSLFVSRTRWLFDKIAGSATLVDRGAWGGPGPPVWLPDVIRDACAGAALLATPVVAARTSRARLSEPIAGAAFGRNEVEAAERYGSQPPPSDR
jgi:hypothetical protein